MIQLFGGNNERIIDQHIFHKKNKQVLVKILFDFGKTISWPANIKPGLKN
jgi:hypothetical protein